MFLQFPLLLLAYTGLRKGEALGLKWEDIDFKSKTLTVKRTRDQHGVRSPKTKNSYRSILIDNELIKNLENYHKWCVEMKFKHGQRLDKEKDYVFISSHCVPVSFNTLNNVFSRIYKQLEKEDIYINTITPHGLRHTYATVLINEGIPPRTVADRLGNTVEMVYRVYAHTLKEMEDKAVSVFSQALAGANIGAK